MTKLIKIIVTFALLSSLSCLSLHSYAGTKRIVDTAANAPKVIKPVPPAPKPPAVVKVKPQTPRHLCSVGCSAKPKNTFNQAATADVKASGASIKSAADALGAGNRLARMQRVNTSKLSPQDAKAFFSSKYSLEKKLETARTVARKKEMDLNGRNLAVFDGKRATEKLLGASKTPGGRDITFHAADRMTKPPRGRATMTPKEVDQVLDGATSIRGRTQHPLGSTLTLENSNMPGPPKVVVDEATGKRIITVINPRNKS